MAVQRRRLSLDAVKEQGKLVAQVMKESTSAMEWEKNWGFLKDKNKLLEEEAEKMGWTKEQFWDAVHTAFAKKTFHTSQENQCENVRYEIPKTTNGMYGWRKGSVLELEYESSIPPVKKPIKPNVIFLG